MTSQQTSRRPTFLLAVFLAVTAAVYWSGLYGGFIFDDYPNIVDNPAVQPSHASISTLAAAALSSPSSQFKRPLASLTFALNYLATGLDPYWMKLTNLAIHLVNGALIYWLAMLLLATARGEKSAADRKRIQAALIAGAWMLLPINLTAVLYVVQRMASLATVFVSLGLIGYVIGRRRAQDTGRGMGLASLSLVLGTAIGFTSKETAVLTPLYAVLIELFLFKGRRENGRFDARVLVLFIATLILPGVIGLAWLLPQVLSPGDWATRPFGLGERLMTEPRVILDYLRWTVLPTPDALSFYHDDYRASTGWLQPWTTLPSLLGIIGLIVAAAWLRNRAKLVGLGIALFLAGQVLTGTILPLELVYEQRSYFASFGVMLAIIPLLTHGDYPLTIARRVLLVGLILIWGSQTALTAYAWGNPLRLSEELARRAPDSPRAMYDLGRTYIIMSHYDPHSPFTKAAYAPLEHAMTLPGSSILPEQALIYMNSHMGLPIKKEWWQAMDHHLRTHPVTVQDESSLIALGDCSNKGLCNIPHGDMIEAYLAALSHQPPSVRLLGSYADYARFTLHDLDLAQRLLADAVKRTPGTAAYRINYTAVLIQRHQLALARTQIEYLQRHDIAGIYAGDIATLRRNLAAAASSTTHPSSVKNSSP